MAFCFRFVYLPQEIFLSFSFLFFSFLHPARWIPADGESVELCRDWRNLDIGLHQGGMIIDSLEGGQGKYVCVYVCTRVGGSRCVYYG